MSKYIHTKRGVGFKMEFICMEFLMGDSKPRRGAILGVAEVTPVADRNHLVAVVLFEGGGAVNKVIRRADYNKAMRENHHITVVEAPDSAGVSALVGADGQVVTRE